MADNGGGHRLCDQPVTIDLFKAADFMKTLAERLIEGE